MSEVRRRNVTKKLSEENEVASNPEPNKSFFQQNKLFLIVCLLCSSAFYLGQKQNTLSSPCSLAPLPKIDAQLDLPSLWGTYRPHTYFSLKTAQPNSPVIGLAWMEQPSQVFQRISQNLHLFQPFLGCTSR